METNFQTDFVETEGFRRIVDAAELEQRQIRLLQAEGFLLPNTGTSPNDTEVPPPSSPDDVLGPLRRSSFVGRMLFSSSLGPARTSLSSAAPPDAGTGGGEGGRGLGNNNGSRSTQDEEKGRDEDGDMATVKTGGGNVPGGGGEGGGTS
ncbi:unnamed protein product [Ectocarpus sp. 12 AP-2014]